jgi:hypothetical protein
MIQNEKLKWYDTNLSIPTFISVGGKNYNLLAQSDLNQCGPASIYNLLTILEIDNNFSDVVSTRQLVPYNLRGETNRENLETFWFTSAAIVFLLEKVILKNNIERFLNKNNWRVSEIANVDGMIIFNNSHYKTIVKKNQQWYLIDSYNRQNINVPIVTEISAENIVNILNRSQESFAIKKFNWR